MLPRSSCCQPLRDGVWAAPGRILPLLPFSIIPSRRFPGLGPSCTTQIPRELQLGRTGPAQEHHLLASFPEQDGPTGSGWCWHCPRGRDVGTTVPIPWGKAGSARHRAAPGPGKASACAELGVAKASPKPATAGAEKSPVCRTNRLPLIPALPAGLGRAGFTFKYKSNCPVPWVMENVPGAPAGGSKTGW